MTDPNSPSFEVTVDDDRAWHVDSEFAEYDATHTVAGALLAGADSVTVTRTEAPETPTATPRTRIAVDDLSTLADDGVIERDGVRIVATAALVGRLRETADDGGDDHGE